MDELKSCKICGKVLQSSENTSVCPDCVSQYENEYEIIREYLYQHPHASIYEVATNLDITINKIKSFLRDGRLEIVEKDNQFLTCQTCSKPIHSGWYCEDCLRQSKLDQKLSYNSSSAGGNDNVNNKPAPSAAETKINFLSKNKRFK